MNKLSLINSSVQRPSQKAPHLPLDSHSLMKMQLFSEKDQHNYEDPTQFLSQRRFEAHTSVSGFKTIFFTPFEQELHKRIYNGLIQDQEFELLEEYEMSLYETKNYTNRLLFKLMHYSGLTAKDFFQDHYIYSYILGVSSILSPSVSTKLSVHYGLYCTTLKALGTDKHRGLLEKAYNVQNLGCFMMTEIAHGSNLQGILTTAHYIHERRSFILNSPNQLAMKFWIGNLARTADHGVVFANLWMGEKNQGIHVFVVKLRDDKGNLLSGMEVGDCGHKLGGNGIDNGWILFKGHEIPYSGLLDKFSQIDEQGQFHSSIQKKSQRFAQ